jgi:hypothetical protein
VVYFYMELGMLIIQGQFLLNITNSGQDIIDYNLLVVGCRI